MNEIMPQVEWVSPLKQVGPPENPGARLLGRVRILGIAFHVNAEQVEAKDDGELVAVIDQGDTWVDEIYAFYPDGSPQTVEIGGRSYLLAITPASA